MVQLIPPDATADEGTTNDDRSILRAVQLSYKLTKAVSEKIAGLNEIV